MEVIINISYYGLILFALLSVICILDMFLRPVADFIRAKIPVDRILLRTNERVSEFSKRNHRYLKALVIIVNLFHFFKK